jgi:hypothetical protein
MTLVVAWFRDGVAYMIADSAVTFEGTPDATLSSFGELQIQGRLAVEERIPKVLRIGSDVLFGFSGSVRRARNFADLLRRDIAAGRHVEQSIHDIAPAFSGGDDGFRAIIAYVQSGASQMLVFSTTSGIERVDSMCVLGSAPPWLVEDVRARIRNLADSDNSRLTPNVVLVSALAQLQAFGIAHRLPEHKIGGVFVGAHVCPSTGAIWQERITYIIHWPGLAEPGDFRIRDPSQTLEIIDCRMHDGTALVISSILNGMAILPSPWAIQQTPAEWEQLLRQLYPERMVLPSTVAPFFVFLNVNGTKAVVLRRVPGTNNSIRFADGTFVLATWFTEHLRIEESVFDCTIVVDPAELDPPQ